MLDPLRLLANVCSLFDLEFKSIKYLFLYSVLNPRLFVNKQWRFKDFTSTLMADVALRMDG